MRAVVIGGSGQIGGWLLRVLSDRGHEGWGTYATAGYPGLTRLDAADLGAASEFVRDRRPDVVFYPAGFTWVDGCERDPARARAANLEQPLNVARASADVGARFVYFSTDYVFDGLAGPYDETSLTNPLSAYGVAKRDAEIALAEALGDLALTVRTSWVFGPERQGKNFAYQLIRTLAAGKPMVVPADQISSPAYGPDVASAVVRLAEQGRSGLVHAVGPEVMGRLAFARGIAEGFGLDPSLVTGKTTGELGQGAPRPLNGGLLAPKLKGWVPDAFRPLAASVADFRALVSEPGRGFADPFAPA